MGRFSPAALIAVLCTASAIGQESPVIRVNVKLVRLLVTVKDQAGALIGSLAKPQFRVSDNGVNQEIAVFERQTSQPLSVAVLVDTSGSTAKELKYELDSVTRFLRTLYTEGNPDDEAALYSFNWQVTANTPFTRKLARIERSLKDLKAEGGTSLYDALYFASRDFRGREGRHVVIVVTDGGDTTSAKTYHQALEALHMADAVMYPILVMPITNDAGRNIGGENALTTLAQSTGGRVFAPSVGAQLDAAFTEILGDLRTQYLLGFYPRNLPETRDRFHRVQVDVVQPGLRALSRSGYYE